LALRDCAHDVRARSRVAFLLTLLFLAPLTHDRVFRSGNDSSRFAQIESLVDRGETAIDGSRYATSDRVTIGGRSYSNKPPLLAVVGAGVYAAMKVAGLSFADDERVVVYLLTLVLIGVPTAWLAARFAAALERAYPDRPWVRRLTVIALVAGTILTSFSVTVNSHTVAAVLLFLAWLSALERRPVLAGCFAALAPAVDTVPGLLFLPVIAYQVRESSGQRGLIRAAAAIAAGAVLAVALNLWIVGSPLPPLFAPGAIDQSGGKNATGMFANIAMGTGLAHPFRALGAALLGSHGFLSVSPILIAGVVGLAVAARRGIGTGGGVPQRGIRVTRAGAVAVASWAAVAAGGHALFVLSLGGWSYGYRYLIAVIPFLLFFVPAAFDEGARRWLAALVAVSIPLALLGAYHPWPPVFEPETPGQGLDSITSPVGANLSAWMFAHAPDSGLTQRLIDRFVSTDQRVSDRYLYLFQQTRGHDDLAREPYLRSLRSDPQSAVKHYDYAEALVGLGDLDQAAQHYGYAVKLAPGFEPARHGLARTLPAIDRRGGSRSGATASKAGEERGE
jgi:hypothetical protein